MALRAHLLAVHAARLDLGDVPVWTDRHAASQRLDALTRSLPSA